MPKTFCEETQPQHEARARQGKKEHINATEIGSEENSSGYKLLYVLFIVRTNFIGRSFSSEI